MRRALLTFVASAALLAAFLAVLGPESLAAHLVATQPAWVGLAVGLVVLSLYCWSEALRLLLAVPASLLVDVLVLPGGPAGSPSPWRPPTAPPPSANLSSTRPPRSAEAETGSRQFRDADLLVTLPNPRW